MTDPIDIKKTQNIYRPFQSKPIKDLDDNFRDFNSEEVYECLSKYSNETTGHWFRLQQAWCNNAYNTFKDYDTYLIQVYLVSQVFKKYSDRFQYLNMDEFYAKEQLAIDKINLIEISQELKIPKETIRRKTNFLQEKKIIYRDGKTIYFDNQNLNNSQRPIRSKALLAAFLEKNGLILSKESWFGEVVTQKEIEKFITDYFTVCWQHWFRMQIPFLVRARQFFGDLETWNVWGAIGISQYTDFSKTLREKVEHDARDYNDLYLRLIRHTPKCGINASSISEISSIPRATVIRKLKYLLKQKLITKNNKLEYMLLASGRNVKYFEENYVENQKYKAAFVTTMFDLMKNSNFKIK